LDLKAKLLDSPLVLLLGMRRAAMPVYVSRGFTSYPVQLLQKQLASWAEVGFDKIKRGRNPQKDITRVRSACEAIGSEP